MHLDYNNMDEENYDHEPPGENIYTDDYIYNYEGKFMS